jgi:hypothetical protein
MAPEVWLPVRGRAMAEQEAVSPDDPRTRRRRTSGSEGVTWMRTSVNHQHTGSGIEGAHDEELVPERGTEEVKCE